MFEFAPSVWICNINKIQNKEFVEENLIIFSKEKNLVDVLLLEFVTVSLRSAQAIGNIRLYILLIHFLI